MIVSSDALLSVVSVLENIPSRIGVPSSEFVRVRVKDKTLSFSLSADIFGTVKIDGDVKEVWESYFDRNSFIPFVKVSKDSGSKAVFKFIKQNNGSIVIKAGVRRGAFNKVANVRGYTDVADVEGVKTRLSAQQCVDVRLCAMYAATDETLPQLNCVYFQKDGMILASNEKSAIRVVSKPIGKALPIPLGILSLLDNPDVKSMVLGKQLAKVNFPIGYVCQSINQKTSRFPTDSINNSIKKAKTYPIRFKVESQKLVRVIKQLNSVGAAVFKKDATVNVIGFKDEDHITLMCKIPTGRFSETVKLNKPLETNFEGDWVLSLLLPLGSLTESQTLTVRFEQNELTPYLISSSHLDLLISKTTKRE